MISHINLQFSRVKQNMKSSLQFLECFNSQIITLSFNDQCRGQYQTILKIITMINVIIPSLKTSLPRFHSSDSETVNKTVMYHDRY